MYLSDIDVRIAQQRYDERVQHARLLRLVRALNAQDQPAALQPAPQRSLAARVWAALFAREPADRRDAALRRHSI